MTKQSLRAEKIRQAECKDEYSQIKSTSGLLIALCLDVVCQKGPRKVSESNKKEREKKEARRGGTSPVNGLTL